MIRVYICRAKVFSNGNYIINGDKFYQIDPASPEGQIIERILSRQKKDKGANKEQKEKFDRITNAKSWKEISDKDLGIEKTGKEVKRRKRKSKSSSRQKLNDED